MNNSIQEVRFIPMPPISWGDDFYKSVSLLVVKTSQGLQGLGSAYTSVENLKQAWQTYQDQVNFNEDDLTQVAKIVENCCDQGLNHQDPELIPALSALDIVLWDLVGKRQNKSIAEMLGGFTSPKIKAYASLEIPLPQSQKDFDAFKDYLDTMLSQNFKAIKLYFPRLGYQKQTAYTQGWSQSQWDAYEASLFETARSIVGPDIDLMLDVFGSADDWVTNERWVENISQALAKHNFLWFEEPFRPDEIHQYQQMSSKLPVPLSACEFFTDPKALIHWADQKAVDILQPDCTCSGGVSTLVKVRDAALSNGLTMIPHGWSTGVGMAADIQVMSTMPQTPLRMVEFMPRPSVTDLLLNQPFALDENGMIQVSKAPGLGVDLSESWLSSL